VERLTLGVLRGDLAAPLAAGLGLPLVDEPAAATLLLSQTDQGLSLLATGKGAPGPVRVELAGGRAAWRRKTGASRADRLCRAVGLGRGTTTVVDATSGLLRDAAALAHAGLSVTALERSRVMAALQEDGLRRARAAGVALRELVLVHADARSWLAGVAGTALAPDVVTIDPMYADSHRSAVPPKEMRLLREVVGGDEDAAALFEVARRAALRRVVVKRPLHAPPLARGESVRLVGNTTRFDVYLTQAS
jgi:16S rRNA (guanine1516-N2)-methyltransferase